jgi:signal transduction histidine kinase
MIGSVRARLTLSVALVVSAIALLAALLAPRMVRDGLIDERLDAQRDLEAEYVGGFVTTVDVGEIDALGLTALIGPDIAALVEGLDEVGALAEMRGYDPDGGLYVLTGPELVATVSADGLVKVGPLDTLDPDRAVISADRLEQLAFDYGVVDPFEFVDPFGADGLPVLDLDELLGFSLGDVIDPSLFDGLPGFEPGSGDVPPAIVDALLDEFTVLTDQDLVSATELLDAPGETTVGTRTIDGRPRILTASLDGIDGSVDRVRTLLWVGLPIAVLSAAMLTWLLAGRSLRPVAAITDQTRKIRSTTLHERVPVPSSHDEIAALATEMNTMLDRVQHEDERRRRFVSDASHELRSPIASIRAQAEAELADTDRRAADLATGVLAEAERLGTLVDDLVSLARHDEQLAPPGQPVDLDDVVYTEASRPRRVPVDVSAVSAGQVTGRPDELARMVTHLLDNAARHAASQVVVSLKSGHDGVRLIVDDDGTGIAPDDRARIFERFTRLDDARTRDRGGAGLGLAVVHAVVGSAGGTIEVDTSPAGGARFVVILPAGS